MKRNPTVMWCAALLWAVAWMSCIQGCDAEPESVPRTTVVEICAEACDVAHCENVIASAASDGSCESECAWSQVECLIDAAEPGEYGGACGECEHVAAECRTACGFGLAYVNGS